MEKNSRLKKIIELLETAREPLSGNSLAKHFKVSRQVIVQDIALLRAERHEIESTTNGYVLKQRKSATRVFKVQHSDEEVRDELKLITDLGGTVQDVFVYHKVYGTVKAGLDIANRTDIDRFMSDIESGRSSLLKNITDGYHYHTVSANSEALLDIIQEKLSEKGYLASLQDYEPVDFWKEKGEKPRKKVRILGTGVATMDIYPEKKRMYPGGNEFNVVCNAALLNAEAGFLGVFGNDLAGELLEETLKELKVDISRCRHEKGSSGYSLVVLKEDGDRIFLDWNKEGVTDLYPVRFTPEEMEYVKSFDVVTMGRVADVSPETIKRLHEKDGIDICYDFHSAFTDDDIDEISPHIKYGFFSCSHLEENEIKRVLKRCVEKGCRTAIGTRGCDPIIAFDGENYYVHEVKKVAATDALGAGDSFIGAFLTAYINGKKEGEDGASLIKMSLKAAADHAATVVVKEGSIGIGYDYDPPVFEEVINKDKSR
ncbi:MAG: HTH domain-containing protein [Lachnospiraceae bacterium]|nr:HTH domain-containing protein [Lachnospiraceae bacterium]